jgi:hypothetical protein
MFDDKLLEDESLKKLLKQVQEKIAMMGAGGEEDDMESSSHESMESPEEEEMEHEEENTDIKDFLEGKQDPEDPIKPKTIRGGAAPQAGVSVAIEMSKKKPYKR